MSKLSCGLLVYKRTDGEIKLLLLHPGGPFWANKDNWTIPKGETNGDEDEVEAARREFNEEVGIAAPDGELLDLGVLKQPPNKTNHIWATEADVNLDNFKCNQFLMEWPPKSGQMKSFPECDRAEWFTLATARKKLFKNLLGFLDRLESEL